MSWEDDDQRENWEWSQPWEDEPWPEDLAGPEYTMAFAGAMGWSAPGSPVWNIVDFYTPRARWVSDR